jgi:uncharacterized protein (UPF0276 family)
VTLPRDGLGLGLRAIHYPDLARRPSVAFFEALAENYLGDAALPRHHLRRAREVAPIALHGVGLDLLGADPLDRDHLRRLRALADELDAVCVSDHLCWTARGGWRSHDLLPAPLTLGTLRWAIDRVSQVQDALQRPFGVENLAAMLGTTHDALEEADLLAALVEATGCGLILDVNNVYVAAHNQGLDADAFFAALEPASILYAHLAGHQRPAGGPIVDTHDAPVRDEVWALYASAWARLGPFPTLVEWDADIPPFARCLEEVQRAAAVRGPAPPPRPAPEPAPEPAPRLPPLRAPPPAELVAWQDGLASLLRLPLVVSSATAKTQFPTLISTDDPAQVRLAAPVTAWPADVVAAVRDAAGLDPTVRLRAYHEQVWFRWLTALQEDHPTLARLMGCWAFNQLAIAHLTAHPPRDPDLGALADGLTLTGTAWDLPPLREALALDVARRRLLALPALPPWTPDPARLAAQRLTLSPAARRLDLTWPVTTLRAAPWTDAPAALPAPAPTPWLLVRTPELALLELSLPPALADLLDLLAAHPLPQALAALEQRHASPTLAEDVRAWLATGVRQGWWTPA